MASDKGCARMNGQGNHAIATLAFDLMPSKGVAMPSKGVARGCVVECGQRYKYLT
jgi:hypothetical protein